MATKKVAKKSAEKLFEGYERREAKILAALKPYGIKSIEECLAKVSDSADMCGSAAAWMKR